jgi:hypothetical protein
MHNAAMIYEMEEFLKIYIHMFCQRSLHNIPRPRIQKALSQILLILIIARV